MSKFIYVIAFNNKFSKIGVASDVGRRREHLQTGCPFELKVLTTFLLKNSKIAFEMEAEIHSRLAIFQTSGEWFEIPPTEAAKAIEEMISDLWRPAQSGSLKMEEIKNTHKKRNKKEKAPVAQKTDLICPHCSHKSTTSLTNKEIWATRFRCSGCDRPVDGRKFFIRRVA